MVVRRLPRAASVRRGNCGGNCESARSQLPHFGLCGQSMTHPTGIGCGRSYCIVSKNIRRNSFPDNQRHATTIPTCGGWSTRGSKSNATQHECHAQHGERQTRRTPGLIGEDQHNERHDGGESKSAQRNRNTGKTNEIKYSNFLGQINLQCHSILRHSRDGFWHFDSEAVLRLAPHGSLPHSEDLNLRYFAWRSLA